VATKHITEEPEPLTNVPADLWAVVAKMMAKRPEDRYQTPAEVTEALLPYTLKREPGPSSGEFEITPPPLPRPRRRTPVWLIGIACAAVAAMAAVAVWLLVSPPKGQSSPGSDTVAARPPDTAVDPVTAKGRAEKKDGPAGGAMGRFDVKPDVPAVPAEEKVAPPARNGRNNEREQPAENKQEEKPAEPARPDPEKVAETLAAARAEYAAARQKLKAELIEAIKADAEQDEKRGLIRQQAQTKEDLKNFEVVGTLPTMPGLKPAVDKYNAALRKAQTAMRWAYDAAIKDFRAAGRLDKVRDAEADLETFKNETPSSTPSGTKKRNRR
jgi:hypothetical protein